MIQQPKENREDGIESSGRTEDGAVLLQGTKEEEMDRDTQTSEADI